MVLTPSVHETEMVYLHPRVRSRMVYKQVVKRTIFVVPGVIATQTPSLINKSCTVGLA